jgi:adenylate cyclase
MSDVFISYARSNATQAQRIAETLRALGYNVWRDDDLPAHRPYADVIDERLRSAKAVVVIWSADAAKSQWVRAEADLARNMGTLVQLRIDDVTPPLPFNQIECADLSNWKGDPKAQGWRKIVGSVAELLGAPAQPPPPRAAAAASRRLTPRRIAIAAGALVLILALVAVAVWRFAVPQGPAQLPGQNGHVDIMAFEPQGADAAVRKAADETQASLVRILAGAGVQVSAVPQGQAPAGDGAELHVKGTVAREADTYVTNAQILDRKSGVILWNERIVRTVKEQGASPEEVADAIAAVLHCALEDRKPSKTPVSTEAFGLYLNACAAVFIGGGHERMLVVTRRLVKVAPQFAGAHAMHAVAAAALANEITDSPAEVAALHAEAKAAAEMALKIDPRTPKAYSGLALNEGINGDQIVQNWFLEEQYLKKGLALDPDLPPARNEYSGLLRSTGRINEAIAFMRETNGAADPRGGMDPRLALMMAARGDLAGAQEVVQSMETTTRNSQDSLRWTIAFWWEDPKTALPKVRSLEPDDRPKVQAACYETYLKELEARKAARARGLPASCDTVDLGWRIRMLARQGDVDGAFAAIKPPVSAGAILLYYPETKALRRDPRFWPLVKRMGLVDYWIKSNNWPDFCSEPDLPYDCRKIARTL